MKRRTHPEGQFPVHQSGVVRDGLSSKNLHPEASQSDNPADAVNFLNLVDGFVFVLDTSGHILHANRSASHRLGYDGGDLRGNDFVKLHPPRQRPTVSKALAELLVENATVLITVPLEAKDGTLIPVETNVTRGQWDGQTVLFAVSREIVESCPSRMFIAVLDDLTVQFGGTGDVVTACELAVDAAARLPGIDGCWIYAVEEGTPALRQLCHTGLPSDFVKDLSKCLGCSFRLDLVQLVTRVYLNRRRLAALMQDLAHREVLQALAVLGIYGYQNRLFGFLIVASHSLADVSIPVRTGLQAIVGQLSTTIARINTEDDFRASEHRRAAVTDDQTEFVMRFSSDGTLTFVNEAYCRYCKVPSDDLIGSDVFEMIPELERKSIAQDLASLGREKAVVTREYQVTDPDGEPRWQRWTYRSQGSDRGAELQFQAVGRDITERVRIADTLSQIERQYRTLVKTATDVICALDLDLRLTYVSPSVLPVLGYTPEELMGTDLLDVLTPTSRERFMQVCWNELRIEVENVQDQLASRIDQIEQYHKDGHVVWMETITSFLRNHKGQPVGILAISHDITGQKQIDQMKSNFVGTVAHELRTPLASVLGFSELLLTRTDLSSEEQERYLQYIRKNAEDMAGIMNDLLDVSRLESGDRISLRRVVFDVGETIGDVVRSWQTQSVTHPLETALPEGPIDLVADKGSIRKLFENVLDNAMKYSPKGSPIRLACEPFEDHYLFSVKDHGIGMKPEHAEQVFQAFYRVDTSNTCIPGIGLGLTVARNIVEALGGRIWIESELGMGTTVRFTLPAGSRGMTDEGSNNEKDTHRG